MDKKYQIIYADPPWSYEFSATKDNKNITGCALQHYQTMSIEDIKALKVFNIADDDCVLFLWATFPLLQEALEVIKAWGFKYKTIAFTWVKTTKDGNPRMGCGFWTRSNAEVCLLATKGKPKRIAKNIPQVIMQNRTQHSAKPPEIRIRIVKLLGNLPRIELFARKENTLLHYEDWDGWDCWGNEVESDIEL